MWYRPEGPFATGKEAYAAMEATPPDLVIMDMQLSGAWDELQLEISNALGRLVRRFTLPETGIFNHELDLSGEPAGVYYLHLHSESGVESVQRVVVQK